LLITIGLEYVMLGGGAGGGEAGGGDGGVGVAGGSAGGDGGGAGDVTGGVIGVIGASLQPEIPVITNNIIAPLRKTPCLSKIMR
jgi:hypothetical protein